MEIDLDSVSNGKLREGEGITTAVQHIDSGASHQRREPESLNKPESDESVLARFGKKQRLKRRFKYLSTIGLTANIMLTWETILVTLQFGLENGGPAGLVYGWLFAWGGSILQGLVMAEMASMIPLAGGAFNWVAVLSPPSCRKFLSYLTGWLTVISWQVFVVNICYLCATLIQGIVSLSYPDYEPQLWHATLLCYGNLAISIFINTVLGRILPRIEVVTLTFYIVGFFAVMIPLLYLSPHNSAADVFTTWQNMGGWSSIGLSFFVGIFSATSSFIGLDGSDHIAEEIESANRVIPLSIWFSAFLNGLLGFAILLVLLFVAPNYDDILKAAYPFMEIFISGPNSFGVGYALIILTTAVNILSISSSLATASRAIWAFARENGMPCSNWLVKVQPESRLPINSIIATAIVNGLLALISIGSQAAFQAFLSVALAAYYSSFLIAAFVMLHKRIVTPSSEIPWGPFRLGRMGIPVTVAAISYTIISVFFSFWPTTNPTTAATMNYSSLLLGAALIFSVCFWYIHGRRTYVGPIWEFDGHFVRAN